MSEEQQPPHPVHVIRTGADLVHLVEGTYAGFFTVTLLLLPCGAAVASLCCLALPGSPGLAATVIASVAWTSGAVLGLRFRYGTYRWLRRSSRNRCLVLLIPLAMFFSGVPPESAFWDVSVLFWVLATVCESREVLAMTTAAAVAYILAFARARTFFAGDSAGQLALFIIVDAVLAWLLMTYCAGHVARLWRNWTSRPPAREEPIFVPNLAVHPVAPVIVTSVAISTPAHPSMNAIGEDLKLTPRQLEVALLLSDGLHQGEIAEALGITERQVGRLLSGARERTGAETTVQLVAMLAAASIAPSAGDAAHIS